MTIDEEGKRAGSHALRPSCEVLFAEELAALKATDTGKRPEGWLLSPKAVRTFIIGSDEKSLTHDWQGSKRATKIRRKFYGDDALIDPVS